MSILALGMTALDANGAWYNDLVLTNGTLKTDTIQANTAGQGVTVEGVLIKDGKIQGVSGAGAWDAANTYSEGDIVSSSGSAFISLQDSNLNNLPTDPAWWGEVSGAGGITHAVADGNAYISQDGAWSSLTAGDIPITDTGSIITAVYVENALQENRTAINVNTAKTSNVTHTGDVTGSTALSIASGVVGANELASTAVVPGSYTAANITVDQDGRIIDAASGVAGSALSVADEGVPLDAAVATINFIGSGVTAVENADHEIDITVAGGSAPVDSIFGRTGAVTAQTGDYTPTQVGLGNVENVNQTNADNISSGTVADLRIAATIARDSELSTGAQRTDWQAAYSWGNHALAGYITAESDPVFLDWDKDYVDLINQPTIPTAGSLSIDDLITLSGVAEGAANYGSFTGTVIPDNQTTKQALQALETAVESPPDPILTGLTGNIQTTGTIKARMEYGADITASVSHDTAELHNTLYHFIAAATVTLDAAADAGYGSTVSYRIRDAAEQCSIDVQAAERINLGGVALAAGTAITAIGAGDFITLVSTTDTDGAGTDGWEAWGNNGWESE